MTSKNVRQIDVSPSMKVGKQAIKWGTKSVGGLVANLALLTVWVDGFQLPPEVAIFINWVLISTVSYVVADRWVFEDADSPIGVKAKLVRYFSMQGIMATSKVANYGIYISLLWMGADYRVAWTVGAIMTFLFTFSGNKHLWNRPTRQSR